MPKTAEEKMRQSLSCPNCGSPVTTDQQFCGICGAKLAFVNVAATQAAPAQQPVFVNEPAMVPVAPPANQTPARIETSQGTEKRQNRYPFLGFAAATFQVLGWIIIIFGGLASIAMIVYAIIGGGFQFIIPGSPQVLGGLAILLGFGSLVLSLLTGLIFVAFGELFIAVIDISKNTKLR